MRRYTTRPKTYYCEELDEEINYPPTLTVIEVGCEAEPTGLIDEHGQDICRLKTPIGFLRFD